MQLWPGSAPMLRQAGLLDLFMGICSNGMAGAALVASTRELLVSVALHDLASARMVRDELLTKVRNGLYCLLIATRPIGGSL